jgi:light-regulated signal transduction histidine kinase (bacteriophytochrome)
LPDVYCDRPLIKLVFQNLIANAIKFTAPRAHARIEIGTASGKEDEIVVFVRDNGVGFDMKYADRLFGVFQRLHGAGQFEGTGIGLANVQRIIHRHGGSTWAEGSVDKGATFYLSIPKKEK